MSLKRKYLLWELAELGELYVEKAVAEHRIGQLLTDIASDSSFHQEPPQQSEAAPHNPCELVEPQPTKTEGQNTGHVFRKAALYCGIYSRVARQLRVTPSVVRRVALGLSKSARIKDALVAEVSGIEKSEPAAATQRPSDSTFVDNQHRSGRQ